MEHGGRLIDYGLATAGATMPWWLQAFEQGAQALILVGSLVLMALRIAIAWREYRDRTKGLDQ